SSCARARGVSQAATISVIAAQNGKSTFRFILDLLLIPIRHTPARSPRIAPLGMRILKNLPEAFCSALREDPHRFIEHGPHHSLRSGNAPSSAALRGQRLREARSGGHAKAVPPWFDQRSL